MIDQQIDIPTKDGHTTTFITHPERGGPFPVLVFYMDAPAIREELRDMARRFGTSGYYVMLPNLYYRSGVMELGPLPADPESPERKRMFQLMNSINIPMVMEDTKALLDDTLARFLPGRTAIFLPHRISTIRSCDRIYLLHNGRIEAEGEHRGLLSGNALYRHLHYLEFAEVGETA